MARMIVYQGLSEIDLLTPIVALATYDPKGSSHSGNSKTGNMIQIAVMLEDIDPVDAIRAGLDPAVCGDCIHRGKASGGEGTCYTHADILRGWAQTSLWRAYKRGKSINLPFDLDVFRGQLVRFGSYGDPAAVPLRIWRLIHSVAKEVTSYTHAWRYADPGYGEFSMASIDGDMSSRDLAASKGYRSYFVREVDTPKPKGMVQCPASKEAGERIDCARCLQCSGTASGRRNDITIMAHGSGAKRYRSLPLLVK